MPYLGVMIRSWLLIGVINFFGQDSNLPYSISHREFNSEICWFLIGRTFWALLLNVYLDLVDLNVFWEMSPSTISNIHTALYVIQYLVNWNGLVHIMM